MSGRVAVMLAVGAAAVVAAGSARADGLPVAGVDASVRPGSSRPLGSARYVTIPAGRADGRRPRPAQRRTTIIRSRLLPGTFTIPAVAYDGLRRWALRRRTHARPDHAAHRLPRARTALLVLGARGLASRATIRLQGDFSFDAISPQGRLLYLIQYNQPRTIPTRYLVRAYDLRRGRLLPAPVVDPKERARRCAKPLSRAVSPDGRWAYTLYDGAGGTPFVHALDTSGRTARCIDLRRARRQPVPLAAPARREP